MILTRRRLNLGAVGEASSTESGSDENSDSDEKQTDSGSSDSDEASTESGGASTESGGALTGSGSDENSDQNILVKKGVTPRRPLLKISTSMLNTPIKLLTNSVTRLKVRKMISRKPCKKLMKPIKTSTMK